jgi:PAS domain S-box-containing protein
VSAATLDASAGRVFPRPRRSIVLLVALVVAGVLGFASVIVYGKALAERRAMEERAVLAADGLIQSLEQEILAAEFLLRGLATSPALLRDDFTAFYEQLIRTPHPPGTWFLLMDEKRQLLNTRIRPGLPLPDQTNTFEEYREHRTKVSGRVWSLSAQMPVVGVRTGVLDADGELKFVLAHVLSGRRITEIIRKERLPAEWATIVFDSHYNPLVDTRLADAYLPNTPRERFFGELAGRREKGTLRTVTDARVPVLLAYSQSAVSGWMVVHAVPLKQVDAPVREAAAYLLGGGVVLLGFAAFGAVMVARRLERPLEALKTSASHAQSRMRSAEAKLLTAEARYRTYWQHTGECLFAVHVTPGGLFVFEGVNPAHERLSGLRSDAIRGQTPHQCLSAEVADAITANYRRCVEAGTTIDYEEVLDLPAGKRRWHTILAPVRDGRTGRIWLILGSARDITRERQVNDRMRAILASISDCYFTADREGCITDINDAALRWLGMERDQVIGRPCRNMFPHFPRQGSPERQMLDQGRPVHNEFPSRLHPGRWVEVHLYPSVDGISNFFRDISERKLAEQAIEKAKVLLDSTINAMSAQVAIVDENGTVLLVNRAWSEFLQRTLSVAAGGVGENYLSLKMLVPSHARDAEKLRVGLLGVFEGTEGEFRFTCQTRIGDEDRWYQINAARFHTDGWTRIVVMHEDVSDVQLAQKAIDDLSERLLHMREEERQRIAVELHDSTAQHLTAMSLNLMALRAQYDGRRNGGAGKLFGDLEKSLAEAQKEIRVFSYLLNPPYLERDGLKSTLARYIEGFARRTGLKAEVSIADAVDDIPVRRQRTVLRVVQEALANVHRHAEAANVQVALRIEKNVLSVEIADDGKGVNGNGQPAPGVGVSGMHARVRELGGMLEITDAGKGTTILAQIPLTGGRRPKWRAASPAQSPGRLPQ